MTESPLLKITDLHVAYATARGDVPAVEGVSLNVHRGRVTSVVGESGSGKSTTAAAVIGLLPTNGRIASGSIQLGDLDLTTLTQHQLRQVRGARIGLVPQDPSNSLNPVKRIGDSVAEALRIHRWKDAAAARKRVLELLERVGIDRPEVRARQYPHELSGGMKQRVLIAAAIALNPELIIADEPTSALDVTVQKRILDLLDELRQDLDTGVLFITHDLAVAAERSDEIVVLQHGKLQESGAAQDVFERPQNAYTQRLLADAPSLHQPSRAARPLLADEPQLVDVQHVRQVYPGRGKDEDFVALDDVSFTVARGSTHAIVGESGSGKTTLGRSIAAFNKPTSGNILVGRFDVTKLTRTQVKPFRAVTQLVYQNPYSSLDPRRTVGAAIEEPLINYGVRDRAERQRRVREYLDRVALPADLLTRRPRELSGGQRQRVAIARALIIEPQLVVLDEAVSALDVTVQAQILRLLTELQTELQLTYIFISHDLAVVRQISDTVSVLRRGQQVEIGATEEIYTHPKSEYTQALLEAIPGQHPIDADVVLV